MTSAAVGSVKTAAADFLSRKKTAGNGDDGTGFQAVWNKQTVENRPEESVSQSKAQESETAKPDRPEAVSKPEEAKSPDKEAVTETGKGKEPVQEVKEPAEEPVSEEEMKAAMEALAGAVQKIVSELTEILGIDESQLQDILGQLGMEETDLLNAKNLMQVVMAASGENDMVQLITNEQLYQDVKQLTGKLETILNELQEKTAMNPEELQQMLQRLKETGGSEETVPVNSIETESTIPTKVQEDAEQLSSRDAENAVSKPLAETEITSGVSEKNSGQGDASGKEQQNAQNPLLQNPIQLQTENSSVQPMAEVQSVWEPDTEVIMKQILDYMKLQVKPDMSSLEMQLHPESLGTLHVQVASKQGVVTAQFTAQNEAVKAALESQMVQLKESFAEQGIKVEHIEVAVQTNAFERNLEQGNRQNQGEGERKNRTRRINLNALFEENPEEIPEEDRIAADMMAANGNTVDYTV